MGVCHEEADGIALEALHTRGSDMSWLSQRGAACGPHVHGLSAHNDELVCPLHEKPGKFVTQDFLDLIGLFDLNANADGID